MPYIHDQTQFIIADVQLDPLAGKVPPPVELEQVYRSMIISASGWRKVFVASAQEEDDDSSITSTDAYIVAIATEAYIRQIKPRRIILGIDTRPTGPAIADIVTRIALAHQVAVCHLFICAAPEIMAYSTYHPTDSFFYITASHNPIGHNGFKFGSRGGVAGSEEATAVIATFRTLLADPATGILVQQLSASVKTETYQAVLEAIENNKSEALVAYERLVLDIATESEDELVFGIEIASLRSEITRHPIGIVAELNGSARTLSIDRQFLQGLGISMRFVNNRPRQIVHPIVPEGENLEQCRIELERAHAEDPSFVLGYVPDNDGDRGNIVYYDEQLPGARILGAQDLFALVACIELTLSKKEGKRQAIVVNGPTSLMIDQIANLLGVTVYRSEVGEANVVNLAEQVRERGYDVRILGEGSNGGNITHPSKVRDPLNTIVSLVKLLSSDTRFKAITGAEGPPTISRALEALPKRTITGGFSQEALLHIHTTDHGALKHAYEQEFLLSYPQRSDELRKRFGICGWREEQTEGMIKREGVGAAFRTPPMRGGLKIVFSDSTGADTDFIWMRGSGTEPVFRIMADAAGHDPQRHAYLLGWQRSLVEKADAALSAQ